MVSLRSVTRCVSSQNAPRSCTRSNTITVRWGQVSSRSLGTGVCTSSLPLPVASVWGQGVGGCPCRWPRAVRTLVGGRQRPVLQEGRPLPGEPGWEQSCRGGSRLRDRGDGRRWGRTRVAGMEGAARAPLSRSPAESRAGFGGPEPRPWAEQLPRGGADAQAPSPEPGSVGWLLSAPQSFPLDLGSCRGFPGANTWDPHPWLSFFL